MTSSAVSAWAVTRVMTRTSFRSILEELLLNELERRGVFAGV
jgi:hypothetical protein